MTHLDPSLRRALAALYSTSIQALDHEKTAFHAFRSDFSASLNRMDIDAVWRPTALKLCKKLCDLIDWIETEVKQHLRYVELGQPCEWLYRIPRDMACNAANFGSLQDFSKIMEGLLRTVEGLIEDRLGYY